MRLLDQAGPAAVSRGHVELLDRALRRSLLTECGGSGEETSAPSHRNTSSTATAAPETTSLPEGALERVLFPAADDVTLAGTLFGEGETAVVLSHMGRGGDTQEDWYGVAAALADRGFTALTYNRRGVCLAGEGSEDCSEGSDDLRASWKDVVGAVTYLESRGAHRVVLVGASIGAISSLLAAASGRIEPAGLIEFGGINRASGYDFTPAQIARIPGSKIFASSRGDIYGGAASGREWYRWASEPKRLVILPGDEHGTDMLVEGEPTAGKLERLIVDFVADVAERPR